MATRVLIVEDDNYFAGILRDYLEYVGYTVEHAGDGQAGFEAWQARRPDLLLTDVLLPRLNGLELSARVKAIAPRVPVVLMSAVYKDADEIRSNLKQCGADDYLIKPFSLPELAARVAALERRAHGASVSRSLQVADLHLDLDAGTLRRGATPIHLKPAAFRLLAHLMANTHRVVPRAELESLLWGDSPPDSDLLRTHIHAIRKEVDTAGREPLVHTSRGVGYRVGEA